MKDKDIPSAFEWNEDVNILLGGAARQGIQTVDQGLTRLSKQAGFHVFASEEYMSRIRDSSNSAQIRIDSHTGAAISTSSTCTKEPLQSLRSIRGSWSSPPGSARPPKPRTILKRMYSNGLHGRALPAATAIQAANPKLTVIAEGGDGDMYGEGGNHFLRAVHRNPDLTHLVHNNMVYGLPLGPAIQVSIGP